MKDKHKDLIKKFIRKEGIFLIILIALAVIYTSPILKNINSMGQRDFGLTGFYPEVERKTILEFNQIPFWNPYYCGGNTMIGHAYSSTFYPLFIIILLLGVPIGIKISYLFHTIIGLIGMYFLSRHYEIDRRVSVLTASMFMFSSYLAAHLTEGLWTWVLIAWIPWAFLFYLKSYEKIKYAALSGLFLGFMFLGGLPYDFTYAALIIALHGLFKLIFSNNNKSKKSKIKVIAVVAIVMLFSVMFISVKLLPTLEINKVINRDREYPDKIGLTPKALATSLFSRTQGNDVHSEFYSDIGKQTWYSTSNYFGILPFLFALIGILFYWRKQKEALGIIVIGTLLTMGTHSPVNLYYIAQYIPFVKFFAGNPIRFKLLFTFFLIIFSGLALTRLSNIKEIKTGKKDIKIKKSTMNIILIVLISLLIVNIFIINQPELSRAFPVPAEAFEGISPGENFYQTQELRIGNPVFPKEGGIPIITFDGKSGLLDANKAIALWKQKQIFIPALDSVYGSKMHTNMLLNKGTVNCYEHFTLLPAAKPKYLINGSLNPIYHGEAYIMSKTNKTEISEATITSFTPNEIKIKIDVKEKSLLVINQNFESGWKTRENKQITNKDGLISTDVDSEDDMITFYYRPKSFLTGAIISIITLLFSIIMFIKHDKLRTYLNKIKFLKKGGLL
ncbi:hypothetical protein ACFL0W_00055 [Nanoarchaeota archaeon]